jgi:adenylate cyclase
MLVEFASAVDAVSCAMTVQSKMVERGDAAPRISFRIGINVGDIIVEGGDIFGDGVNVAARIENECEPGGVFLSGSAFEQVRGKTEFAFDDLGERSLKNIERPVRLYAVRSPTAEPVSLAQTSVRSGTVFSLPDKPSIAVLPFQNMSGDSEQEYFADGIVEDIITALSRFKSLFVIARNSSFTYKGKRMDIRQVGRELGVRYILEGSVRKAGGRVRVASQLIDAVTGTHLWADRFDSAMEDVFELQDQLTSSVVAQLFSRVQLAEQERSFLKPTANLDAYDYYLRGTASLWGWNKEAVEKAEAHFSKAIELDQSFALAHAYLAGVFNFRKQSGWMIDFAAESDRAVRHARRAVELGREDAVALAIGGFTLAYVGEQLDFGADCIARGLSLNDNFALGCTSAAG